MNILQAEVSNQVEAMVANADMRMSLTTISFKLMSICFFTAVET
jgi:hypothetical protein